MSSSFQTSSFILVGGSKRQTLRKPASQVTFSDINALTCNINVALTELQRRIIQQQQEALASSDEENNDKEVVRTLSVELKQRVTDLETKNNAQTTLLSTILDTMRHHIVGSCKKRRANQEAIEEEDEEDADDPSNAVSSSSSEVGDASFTKKRKKNKHIHKPGILHYSAFKHELVETTEEYKRYNIIVSLFTGPNPQLAPDVWHLRKANSKLLKEAGAKSEFWTHMKLHKHIPTLALDDDVETGRDGPHSCLPELLLKVDKDGKTWIRYNTPNNVVF